ncbi:MAG TPA: MarC family protein [Nitrospiria bacterium]|nr:MarC family protein [Nitrospiria bacterium]
MATFLKHFIEVFSALFPVINPPGMALLFLAMTRRATRERRSLLAKRIAIYSLLVIGAAYFLGKFILVFFGISLPVLRVAGGMVLVSSGWRLLTETREQGEPEIAVADAPGELENIAFYPLTLPITTGPGTISVAIALGAVQSFKIPVMLGVVTAGALISAIIYLCYRYAYRIEGALGQTGSEALSRLFAFILICIGVQILWAGFSELWVSLPSKSVL